MNKRFHQYAKFIKTRIFVVSKIKSSFYAKVFQFILVINRISSYEDMIKTKIKFISYIPQLYRYRLTTVYCNSVTPWWLTIDLSVDRDIDASHDRALNRLAEVGY